MRAAALLLSVALAAITFAGCGRKAQPTTPEGVAQALAAAMAKGDTEAAALLWDYVSEARRSNSDWDDIPSGQRQQILRKLRSEKADALKAQTAAFSAEMKARAPSVSGQAATVPLAGGPQGTVVVQLAQTDGKWGVTGFGPATGG